MMITLGDINYDFLPITATFEQIILIKMTNYIKTGFLFVITILTINSTTAQTKSVLKAQKAYLEKNWEKFNDYLIKENFVH